MRLLSFHIISKHFISHFISGGLKLKHLYRPIWWLYHFKTKKNKIPRKKEDLIINVVICCAKWIHLLCVKSFFPRAANTLMSIYIFLVKTKVYLLISCRHMSVFLPIIIKNIFGRLSVANKCHSKHKYLLLIKFSFPLNRRYSREKKRKKRNICFFYPLFDINSIWYRITYV